MRLYEIVYVFDPERSEDDLTGLLERFHKLAISNGGEVEAVDHWGVRQLAYPIRKHKSGYYVVAHVRASADALPEFERILRLEPSLVRYLIVLNEGEPTTGLSIVAPRSTRGEAVEPAIDEDEDEDEDPTSEGPPEFSGGRGRRRRMDGPAIQLLNYKDVGTLSKFMTEEGKILPRRTTRVTAGFQRNLGRAVKRARFVALIPYVSEHRA